MLEVESVFRTAVAQLSLYNHFPLRLHFVRNEQVRTSYSCPMSCMAFLIGSLRFKTTYNLDSGDNNRLPNGR